MRGLAGGGVEMKSDWKTWPECLLEEYKSCRRFPGWKQILENHDEEDRNYFDRLDEEVAEGKSKIEFEKP